MALVEKWMSTTGGGAHDGSSEADAWTLAEMLANVAAGNLVNAKAGTYTLAATLTNATAGTIAAPIVVRGYTTTPGDAVQPVVTFDGSSVAAHCLTTGAAHWLWAYCTFYGNTGGAYDGVYSAGTTRPNTFYRCRATHTGRAGFYLADRGAGCIECEVDNWANSTTWYYGIYLGQLANYVAGCHVHGDVSGGRGIGVGDSGGSSITDTVIRSTYGYGLLIAPGSTDRPLRAENITIHDASSDGVYFSSATLNPALYLKNALITNAAGYGINGAGANTHVFADGLATYGNASGDVNTSEIELIELRTKIALSELPYRDAASGDMRIKTSLSDIFRAGGPQGVLSSGVWTPYSVARGYGGIGIPYTPRRT